MLTIKHQTPHGTETLCEANNISFCPVEGAHLDQPVGTAKEQLGVLYYRTARDQLEELSGGMVYVMNASGSTVGKYDLGRWGTEKTEV